MARKKYAKKARSAISRVVTRVKSRGRRFARTPMSSNPFKMALYGAGYGAGRSTVSKWIAPYTSKIPFLRNYSDEAGMLVLGMTFATGKVPLLNIKVPTNPMLKELGKAAVYVESAVVGADMASGAFTGNFAPQNTSGGLW